MDGLNLIPTDELIKELESRSVALVLAYQTFSDKDKGGNTWYRYGKGNWTQAIGLVTVLKNDILNNWNNELKALQRAVEDGLF